VYLNHCDFDRIFGYAELCAESEVFVRITRALITAASPVQQTLPLQRLVDRDGVSKTLLHIIVAEAVHAGIAEVVIVVAPNMAEAYRNAINDVPAEIRFVEQAEPRGYGHAILQAQSAMANEPFLHLVGDHIYIADTQRSCAQQVIDLATSEDCAVSAVQSSREHLLPYYGVVGGRPLPSRAQVYTIDRVIEKPTPTEAEQQLLVPGLRAGHYLCQFGMHVLTSSIFDILAKEFADAPNQVLQLSPALNQLAQQERYLALAHIGRRYDTGAKYGLLTAQLALGLHGDERDEVMATLVELLMHRRGE
jgi:UTP--glucose-1-phosphate uridylyltransferase